MIEIFGLFRKQYFVCSCETNGRVSSVNGEVRRRKTKLEQILMVPCGSNTICSVKIKTGTKKVNLFEFMLRAGTALANDVITDQ